MESSTENYISRGEIFINDPSTCFICKKTDLNSGEKYCASCGFPQNGESTERIAFYRDHLLKKNEFNLAVQDVKRVKNTLFIVSGLCVFSGLVLAAIDKDEDPMIILMSGLGLAVVFLCLGFWSQSKPLSASITGVIIYITFLIISVAFYMLDESERKGLPFGVVDIAIIIFLARGIGGALKAERFRKEKGWDWKTNQ